MMSVIKLAILAPGAMGAAVARRLVDHGVDVLTLLDGRSEVTRARAHAAGMRAAPIAEIAQAELILSIVPPAEAVTLAQHMAPILQTHSFKGAYVDCNAINPASMSEVAQFMTQAGIACVDASIIGLPPREGYDGPTFFAAGEATAQFARLSERGLKIHVLDGPIGSASALKMCYGGITKGLIAVGAAMMLAATRSGADRALFEEMSRSQSNLLTGYSKSIPDMFGKAARWIAEMEQIAEFLGPDRAESEVFRSFADFYRRLGSDHGAAGKEIAQLESFFKGG
jgi:3-hydroxyisobutyrate dehydrogenase-like beta-hydroxyacid dehydrogenase